MIFATVYQAKLYHRYYRLAAFARMSSRSSDAIPAPPELLTTNNASQQINNNNNSSNKNTSSSNDNSIIMANCNNNRKIIVTEARMPSPRCQSSWPSRCSCTSI